MDTLALLKKKIQQEYEYVAFLCHSPPGIALWGLCFLKLLIYFYLLADSGLSCGTGDLSVIA